jgi:hypothetical protein
MKIFKSKKFFNNIPSRTQPSAILQNLYRPLLYPLSLVKTLDVKGHEQNLNDEVLQGIGESFAYQTYHLCDLGRKEYFF